MSGGESMQKTREQLKQNIKFLKELVTMDKEDPNLKKTKARIHKNHLSQDDIYSFSTENVKAAMHHLDLKDKNVCTVLASGDQAISARYYGAKEVVCFDINQLTKYYMDLKVAALKKLDYRDFLHFFINHYDGMYLNYRIFSHIKPLLPQDSQIVWEELYQVVDYQGSPIYHSALFNNTVDQSNLSRMKIMIPYIENERSYLETQKKMGNFQYQFESCELSSLPYILEDKFDFIFISNIMEHLLDEKLKTSSESELLEKEILKTKEEMVAEMSNINNLNLTPDELTGFALQLSHAMSGGPKQDLKQILFQFRDLLTEEMPNLLTKQGEIILHQLFIFPPKELVETLHQMGTVLGYQTSDVLGFEDYNHMFTHFSNSLAYKNKEVDGVSETHNNKIYYIQKPNYKKK